MDVQEGNIEVQEEAVLELAICTWFNSQNI